MAVLDKLWIGLRSESFEDAGTSDNMVLIVNQDGIDLVHHTLPKGPDRNGQLLHSIDVSSVALDSDKLNAGSVRLAIRGNDAWFSEDIAVWGELRGQLTAPLAMSLNFHSTISTDPDDGANNTPVSIPLRQSMLARGTDTIKQFFVAIETADIENAGTEDTPELVIELEGSSYSNYDDESNIVPSFLTDRGQQSFRSGIGFGILGEPPTREKILAVKLRAKSRDLWIARRLFVFGHAWRNGTFGPVSNLMVPIVYIIDWQLPILSLDTSEGMPEINLPLCELIATDPLQKIFVIPNVGAATK